MLTCVGTLHQNCVNQKSVKMVSRSGDGCLADMYTCGPKYGVPRLYSNGETNLITKT